MLVVGTTSDYVQWIDETWPGRAIFLTDPHIRQNAHEPAPDEGTEILADLRCYQHCRQALEQHLNDNGTRISGIMCFDCETMPLAAYLAERMGLPYPSQNSVRLCRDKFACKEAWHNAEVNCPDAAFVSTVGEAINFFRKAEGSCVLKPQGGSGSELVFLCMTVVDVIQAFSTIKKELSRKKDNRLYSDSGLQIVAEAYVAGPEYSCDFLIDERGAKVIRLAKKIPMRIGPFGTILGYDVPGALPCGTAANHLAAHLEQAARALGITRAICMVDFLWNNGTPVFLEIAPRPGGDCLPNLIRQAAGIDTLGLALDVAQGWPIDLPGQDSWQRCVGVRIHAHQQGILVAVDTSCNHEDPRVIEVNVNRSKGHTVVLPPHDYDSWILGYIIFKPEPGRDIESQCNEVLGEIRITMEEAA